VSVEGSCHCGAVRVRLADPLVDVTECNCSLCRRTGALWAYAAPDRVTIDGTGDSYIQGDGALTLWRCHRCGIVTHWTPTDPAYGRMGVNLRLFDPALWASLPRVHVNGASW
jgi:hypothetical protein